MADRMPIGTLAVPPETLGWIRAPHLDRKGLDGRLSKAYIDREGRPNLFPPGVTPALQIMTVGQYQIGRKH